MGWLALGAAYSIVYAIIGAYLRPFPDVLPVVSNRCAADTAAGWRRPHRAPPAHVGRMPLALLGHARAWPPDVGHQRHRLVGRRDAARCQHVVARMARRLRVVWRRRAAARAAGAAASGSPRKSHRDHCRRYRRHRRAHRLPLLTFRRRIRSGRRDWRVGAAAAALRASAVPRLPGHGHRGTSSRPTRDGSRSIGGSAPVSRSRSSRSRSATPRSGRAFIRARRLAT